jgi:hypothetical protein
MQPRVKKIASFFAFNILFFALYLNFIDRGHSAGSVQQTETTSFSSNLLNSQLERTVLTRVASIK